MNAPLTLPRTLSPQQANVVDWGRDGSGSAFVEAVAGAGKTTTLIELLKVTEGSVAFAAYNKAIATEIGDKVKKLELGNRIRVGTYHSFGFSAWRRIYPNVKVDDKEKENRTERFLAAASVTEAVWPLVHKLVSLAKQRALGVFGSIADESQWYDIVEHFDLAYEVEDEELIEIGVKAAIRVLRKHLEVSKELINFDDMIYAPIATGCRMWENDWVLTDEAQDTNPARHALARKMLRPGGRSCWVGDRAQSIYGFSGADSDAIDKIVRDFRCTVLPLTVTYRCTKAVVAEARKVVDHIEAHESAPEGVVRCIEAIDIAQEKLTASDAILCRNTKPLVEEAYKCIRRGIACHVEGRDIGVGLLKLVNRFQAKSVNVLLDKLDAFLERETQKLVAKGKETQAEMMADKVETVKVIAEGCATVDQVRTKIAAMFLDSGDIAIPTLTFSTVHKAKGREWNRVYILGYETLMPSRFARQEWQLIQEANIKYVAVTRAKQELVLID